MKKKFLLLFAGITLMESVFAQDLSISMDSLTMNMMAVDDLDVYDYNVIEYGSEATTLAVTRIVDFDPVSEGVSDFNQAELINSGSGRFNDIVAAAVPIDEGQWHAVEATDVSGEITLDGTDLMLIDANSLVFEPVDTAQMSEFSRLDVSSTPLELSGSDFSGVSFLDLQAD